MVPIENMMRDIAMEVRYTRSYIGKEALDARVMAAMRKVPRDKFVPTEMRPFAYENGPLSIGCGQTISQPYIVALMTDMLAPSEEDVILEVGSGCGYQAAVLSLLVKHVYSIEIVSGLAEQAHARLQRLGYHNVSVRVGDGYFGWQQHAPFDGIVVTAAAPYIPPALVEQLKPGGRLAIPVGLPHMHQELFLIEKDAQGEVTTSKVLDVAFVPLTGEHDNPSAKQ